MWKSFNILLGGMAERATCVGHVVDKDGNFVANVTDKHHWRHFVGLLAFFVNQRKVDIQLISNGRYSKHQQHSSEYTGKYITECVGFIVSLNTL